MLDCRGKTLLSFLVILCAATTVLSGCAGQSSARLQPVDGRDAILTLWGMESPDLFPQAKEMGVDEVYLFSSDPVRLAAYVEKGKKYGILVYGCATPLVGKQLPTQEMNAKEDACRARILADKTKEKNGYQFGGEPYLPLEVLDLNINCFHDESVREAIKKSIRDTAMVKGIAGIAFDFFGYDNYRGCRCLLSMKLAGEYHRNHPGLTEDKAFEAFSLESLVDFYNDMADYARSQKQEIKVACHVHPVFLPEIYYGNRLKRDVCCQTAAWFMEPFWPKERIEEHVRVIFGEEKKYWSFAEGAALLGSTFTAKASHPPKLPERVEFELRTMLAAGADRIQVCSGGDLMRSPSSMEVFKRIFNPDAKQ